MTLFTNMNAKQDYVVMLLCQTWDIGQAAKAGIE
jgi:hypothetical protein